jgi:hypothetical protein
VPSDVEEGTETAWLLMHPSRIPASAHARVIPMVMVRLPAGDAAALLEEPEQPDAPPVDANTKLLILVARGIPKSRMATELGISPRTLDRRLRVLRERHGARTLPELTSILARSGHLGRPR